MCECFQIGGPFIAEDPDCPEHGTAAQIQQERTASEVSRLQQSIHQAQTIDDLRDLMLELLDLIET